VIRKDEGVQGRLIKSSYEKGYQWYEQGATGGARGIKKGSALCREKSANCRVQDAAISSVGRRKESMIQT